jgi:hypothetical protein
MGLISPYEYSSRAQKEKPYSSNPLQGYRPISVSNVKIHLHLIQILHTSLPYSGAYGRHEMIEFSGKKEPPQWLYCQWHNHKYVPKTKCQIYNPNSIKLMGEKKRSHGLTLQTDESWSLDLGGWGCKIYKDSLF